MEFRVAGSDDGAAKRDRANGRDPPPRPEEPTARQTDLISRQICRSSVNLDVLRRISLWHCRNPEQNRRATTEGPSSLSFENGLTWRGSPPAWASPSLRRSCSPRAPALAKSEEGLKLCSLQDARHAESRCTHLCHLGSSYCPSHMHSPFPEACSKEGVQRRSARHIHRYN